jgi:hypothetical protein
MRSNTATFAGLLPRFERSHPPRITAALLRTRTCNLWCRTRCLDDANGRARGRAFNDARCGWGRASHRRAPLLARLGLCTLLSPIWAPIWGALNHSRLPSRHSSRAHGFRAHVRRVNGRHLELRCALNHLQLVTGCFARRIDLFKLRCIDGQRRFDPEFFIGSGNNRWCRYGQVVRCGGT